MNQKSFTGIVTVIVAIVIVAGVGGCVIKDAPDNHTTIKKVFETRSLGFILQPAFSEDYLYAAGEDGLFVLNITKPAAPVVVQTIPADRPFGSMYVDGQYVYVTYGRRDVPIGGLRIYRRDPTGHMPLDPEPIGSVALPRGPISVFVTDNTAYVGDYSSGAFLIDVADKTNPRILSNLKFGEERFYSYEKTLAHYLDILNLTSEAGLFAYLRATYPDVMTGHTDDDVRVFISDAGLVGHSWWMKSFGDILYLPYDGEGMYSVRITNKTNPAVLDNFRRICFGESERCYFNDVSVVGNYAIAVIDYGGLLVLDVSDPSNMKEVTQVRPWKKDTWAATEGHMVQIRVEGNAAFVTALEDGVHVFDISNPSLPVFLQKESSNSTSAGKGCAWGLDTTSNLLAVGYGPCVTDHFIAGALELYEINAPVS